MKKLNNRGWGLPVAVVIVCFLLFVLLFVVVLVYKAYWQNNVDLIHEEYIIKK